MNDQPGGARQVPILRDFAAPTVLPSPSESRLQRNLNARPREITIPISSTLAASPSVVSIVVRQPTSVLLRTILEKTYSAATHWQRTTLFAAPSRTPPPQSLDSWGWRPMGPWIHLDQPGEWDLSILASGDTIPNWASAIVYEGESEELFIARMTRGPFQLGLGSRITLAPGQATHPLAQAYPRLYSGLLQVTAGSIEVALGNAGNLTNPRIHLAAPMALPWEIPQAFCGNGTLILIGDAVTGATVEWKASTW